MLFLGSIMNWVNLLGAPPLLNAVYIKTSTSSFQKYLITILKLVETSILQGHLANDKQFLAVFKAPDNSLLAVLNMVLAALTNTLSARLLLEKSLGFQKIS